MRLFKTVFLCVALFAFSTQAKAETSQGTQGQSMTQMEQQGWKKAWGLYGTECLPTLDPGELVPPEMAVDAMRCYQRQIYDHVVPHAHSKEDLQELLDRWFETALDFQNGDITEAQNEEEYLDAWYDYVKARDAKLKDLDTPIY